MPTVEFNDNKLALEYIKNRGYASYSSMKNVRDCEIPSKFVEGPWLAFGKELHSRALEGIVLDKLSTSEEKLLKAMLKSLKDNALVQGLWKSGVFEDEFKKKVYGVNTLGYLDHWCKKRKIVTDLKSTRLTSHNQFVESMDFLQAALYLYVTGAKEFYYVGISKTAPHNVFIFAVSEYPGKLMDARLQLEYLLKYINTKLYDIGTKDKQVKGISTAVKSLGRSTSRVKAQRGKITKGKTINTKNVKRKR